jgi:hypothetical protein
MRARISVKPMMVAVVIGLVAAGAAAQAQDFEQPFFGGGYAPAPGYAYGGYGQSYGGLGASVGVGVGVAAGAVGYDQGYYYGGYQYPAGGYGGGPYRRAAYSAADVYVSGGYPAPYGRRYAPYPVYRPYARGYYAPTPAYGGYYNAGYSPYRGLRQRCQCVLY